MQGNDYDLQDSPRDEKYLEPETVNLDLPDVQDIPGQEHIHPPLMREMADTTISSSDEEGVSVFSDKAKNTDADILDEGEDDANVSDLEKEMLQQSSESTSGNEDMAQKSAMLDDVDNEGEKLNEAVNYSGSDLDVPGAELDDDNEEIGEEDEENNSYSMGQ